MVESKVEVLLRISEMNLRRAEKRFETGEFDSAVFHASMALETAANAMILILGGAEAKDHRAISGLAAVMRRVTPELLKEQDYVQVIAKGRDVQREVVWARYPLKVGGKWVTPDEYYTREKARAVIDDANFVVDKIKKFIMKNRK
jgi:HEPN domain-containing protein